MRKWKHNRINLPKVRELSSVRTGIRIKTFCDMNIPLGGRGVEALNLTIYRM